MEELEIGDDIKQMLEHMNMQSFFTMAYPTYEDESCQFLASLVATFHTTKHVRQGWGKIKFKSPWEGLQHDLQGDWTSAWSSGFG